MLTYLQYEFYTKDENQRDFLMALLAEEGFDGFEELNESVRAFIPEQLSNTTQLIELLKDHHLDTIPFEHKTIAPKNWNEEWERSFQPINISNRVSIRAPFHEPVEAQYELIIEPKMSFGTGHHPTTSLMIQQMLALDFNNQEILDFGTGTGVLAILAMKMGAAHIIATDNEEWAVENCKENIERNGVAHIDVLLAESIAGMEKKFDCILANINRNVIMKNLQSWRTFLKVGGVLIVSGILVTDTIDILKAATEAGFVLEKQTHEEGWVSIVFKSKTEHT